MFNITKTKGRRQIYKSREKEARATRGNMKTKGRIRKETKQRKKQRLSPKRLLLQTSYSCLISISKRTSSVGKELFFLIPFMYVSGQCELINNTIVHKKRFLEILTWGCFYI